MTVTFKCHCHSSFSVTLNFINTHPTRGVSTQWIQAKRTTWTLIFLLSCPRKFTVPMVAPTTHGPPPTFPCSTKATLVPLSLLSTKTPLLFLVTLTLPKSLMFFKVLSFLYSFWTTIVCVFDFFFFLQLFGTRLCRFALRGFLVFDISVLNFLWIKFPRCIDVWR